MGKMKLSLSILFRYFEDDLCTSPFAFIFCKIEIVTQNLPNNFFIWNNFSQFHSADMNILVMISKLIIEFVSVTFNFFRPPSTNIIYCIKNLLWCLIYQDR